MTTALAFTLFTVGAFLMWKGKAPTLVAWLWLLAGTAVTSGVLGSAITTAVGAAVSATNAVTQAATGAAIPYILGLVTFLFFAFGVFPKKKGGSRLPGGNGGGGARSEATRATAVAGLFLPSLVATIPGQAGNGLSQALTALSSFVGSFLSGLVA